MVTTWEFKKTKFSVEYPLVVHIFELNSISICVAFSFPWANEWFLCVLRFHVDVSLGPDFSFLLLFLWPQANSRGEVPP